METKKENIAVLKQFDTYISVVENSVGSFMFKSLYADVNGEKVDLTQDGWLSCAFFVSSVLSIFKFIKSPHATVSGTINDLKDSGWVEIDKPVVGSVLVWGPNNATNGHYHIGFYVGENQAISNDSRKKHPWKGDWKFDGKREVEMILWNPDIEKR